VAVGAGVAAASSVEVVAYTQAADVPAPPPPNPDRWEQAKEFLNSWRRWSSRSTEVPLPADKLACHLPPPGTSLEKKKYRPVVLVCCGSFNPPTYMHLRMLELARQAMNSAGMDVVGAYLSPVNDAYWRKALVAGRLRVRMCQLAAQDSGRYAPSVSVVIII